MTRISTSTRRARPVRQRRTTRPTRALATCGVYGRASDDEMAIIDLANEYRRELCLLLYGQHMETTLLRNRLFPSLYRAMELKESNLARIFAIERLIKEHHSDVRNRNAVTDEQRDQLRTARAMKATHVLNVRREMQPWNALCRSFKTTFSEAAEWDRIKLLSRRRQAYAALTWPAEMEEYAEVYLRYDLLVRELGQAYKARGLHSAIRKEIYDASKPKLVKDGPGMRYRWGRQPQPKPWTKITLQFGGGGLLMSRACSTSSPSFGLEALYTNHKSHDRDETVFTVRQQIGTREFPRLITYRFKLHKPLPETARLQRWSLVVNGDRKRSVIPIVSDMPFGKPIGNGVLAYDITWTRRSSGVQVAQFAGDHVNETLILPNWLVDQRMSLKDEQQRCDLLANAWLEEQRGISSSRAPGSRHGTDALEDYVDEHAGDLAAANILVECLHDLRVAQRVSSRAIRTIEKIYDVVVWRVCQLHSRLVVDPIDLARVKRYSTRDLLRVDVLPPPSREILHATAVGKLQARLRHYGLAEIPTPRRTDATPEENPPPASGPVHPELPEVSRDTNLFSTYILSLCTRTGPRPQRPNRRSQHNP